MAIIKKEISAEITKNSEDFIINKVEKIDKWFFGIRILNYSYKENLKELDAQDVSTPKKGIGFKSNRKY